MPPEWRFSSRVMGYLTIYIYINTSLNPEFLLLFLFHIYYSLNNTNTFSLECHFWVEFILIFEVIKVKLIVSHTYSNFTTLFFFAVLQFLLYLYLLFPLALQGVLHSDILEYLIKLFAHNKYLLNVCQFIYWSFLPHSLIIFKTFFFSQPL